MKVSLKHVVGEVYHVDILFVQIYSNMLFSWRSMIKYSVEKFSELPNQQQNETE